MSDYQDVQVTKKSRRVVTIEVHEDNPDVAALAAVIEAGRIRPGAEDDAIKLAAMLLLEDKARSGDLLPPDDEPPAPEQFVSKVELVSAEPIGADDHDQPRFRATLAITLARAADAALFEVGERWGAVALVSGDFDDMFS